MVQTLKAYLSGEMTRRLSLFAVSDMLSPVLVFYKTDLYVCIFYLHMCLILGPFASVCDLEMRFWKLGFQQENRIMSITNCAILD